MLGHKKNPRRKRRIQYNVLAKYDAHVQNTTGSRIMTQHETLVNSEACIQQTAGHDIATHIERHIY